MGIVPKGSLPCVSSDLEYFLLWGPSSVWHWERNLELILNEIDTVSTKSIFQKKESHFCIWDLSCPVKADRELGVFPGWYISAAGPAQSKLLLWQWFVYEWATKRLTFYQTSIYSTACNGYFQPQSYPLEMFLIIPGVLKRVCVVGGVVHCYAGAGAR